AGSAFTIQKEKSDMPEIEKSRQYKYRSDDFGRLPVSLHHLTMYINFAAGSVEIISVEFCTGPEDEHGISLVYEYIHEKNRLIVKLPQKLKAGERFFV